MTTRRLSSSILPCLLIGLVPPSVSSCSSVSPSRDPSVDGWKTLVTGESLDGWHAQDRSRPHTWQTARSVAVDPKDNRSFTIRSGQGVFVNARTGRTQNLVSNEEFADVEAHVEFTIPSGSNSGIFFMGLYELQVEDSFGKEKIVFSDCGGFYARKVDGKWVGGTPPRVNACRAPGVWKTFDVKFRAPRFDTSGTKTENARFLEVRHNGVLIHEDVEMKGPNSAHMDIPEAPRGSLMLQGDHGPVAYRNVRIRPLSSP